MFTLLKVVGERARSPTTFVMITNHFCQLYPVEYQALCLAASAAHRRTEFPEETQDGDARNRPSTCFGMPLGAVAQRLGVRS